MRSKAAFLSTDQEAAKSEDAGAPPGEDAIRADALKTLQGDGQRDEPR